MRRGVCLALFLAAGCAARPQPQAAPPTVLSDEPEHVVTALIFTPPILQGEPPLDLARDVRQPSAFVAFEEMTSTFFYLRIDDRQTTDHTDRYVRRAIIEKHGVSYR